MKNLVIIISLVVALGIGGGIGYYSGKGANNNEMDSKKLQESITMMKEQSLRIQKMGEMMKSGGETMQEMGTKYNDEEAVTKGKDLAAVGAKYMEENKKSESSETMKPIM